MTFFAATNLSLNSTLLANAAGTAFMDHLLNPPDVLAPLSPADSYQLCVNSGHHDAGGGSEPVPTLTQLYRDHHQIKLTTHRTLRWLSSVMAAGSWPAGMVSGAYFESAELMSLLTLPTLATGLWLCIDLVFLLGTERQALTQFEQFLPNLQRFDQEMDLFCKEFDECIPLDNLSASPAAIQKVKAFQNRTESWLKMTRSVIGKNAFHRVLRNPLMPILRWFTDDRILWFSDQELQTFGEQLPEVTDPTYTLQRSLIRAEAFVKALEEILPEEVA